jgi:hypothetical protein
MSGGFGVGHAVWSGRHVDRLPDPPRQFCCDAAERLAGWVEAAFVRLTPEGHEPTLPSLKSARLALTEQWFAERLGVTKKHRDRLTDREGLPCLYGVYVAAMERMQILERSLQSLLPQPDLTPRNDPFPPWVTGIHVPDDDDDEEAE